MLVVRFLVVLLLLVGNLFLVVVFRRLRLVSVGGLKEGCVYLLDMDLQVIVRFCMEVAAITLQDLHGYGEGALPGKSGNPRRERRFGLVLGIKIIECGSWQEGNWKIKCNSVCCLMLSLIS